MAASAQGLPAAEHVEKAVEDLQDWVEDHVLAVIGAGMAGDDIPATADHHLVDVAS